MLPRSCKAHRRAGCIGEVGSIDYLKQTFHMTVDDIVKAAQEVINRKK